MVEWLDEITLDPFIGSKKLLDSNYCNVCKNDKQKSKYYHACLKSNFDTFGRKLSKNIPKIFWSCLIFLKHFILFQIFCLEFQSYWAMVEWIDGMLLLFCCKELLWNIDCNVSTSDKRKSNYSYTCHLRKSLFGWNKLYKIYDHTLLTAPARLKPNDTQRKTVHLEH